MVKLPFYTAFFDEKRVRSIPETITPGIFTLCRLPSLSTTVPGRVPVPVPNTMWLPAMEILRGVSSTSALSIWVSDPGIMVSSKQWSEELLSTSRSMESDCGASFGRVLVINDNPLSSTSGTVRAGGDSVPRVATLALAPSWPFRCALHSALLCVGVLLSGALSTT